MTTTEITFRRTKAGQWVGYGPYDLLKDSAGCEITITKRGGETVARMVTGLGAPFDDRRAGRKMVYAYFDDAEGRPRRPRRGGRRCQECGSSYGVHEACDLSGIPGWACNRCDDGTLSFY